MASLFLLFLIFSSSLALGASSDNVLVSKKDGGAIILKPTSSIGAATTALTATTTGITVSVPLVSTAGVSGYGIADVQTATVSLTNTSSDIQLFASAPAAPVTLTMPTTDIKKGRRFEILTRAIGTTNPITVNSSGAGLIRTLRNTARLVLVAVIDTPAAAADWAEETYKEEGVGNHSSFTWTCSAAPSGTRTDYYYYQRDGNRITVTGMVTYSVTGTACTRLIFTAPSFLRPFQITNGPDYTALVQGGVWQNLSAVDIPFSDGLFHQSNGNIVTDFSSANVLALQYSTTFYSTYNN
jgi:hypothetical protein